MRLEPAEDVPIYAVTCVSKGLWFWAVWVTFSSYQNHGSAECGLPQTSGYTATKALALQYAKKAAGFRGCYWRSGMASRYHREKRARHLGKGEQISQASFVYADWYPDGSEKPFSTPHHVIKITQKRVYVDLRSYSPDNRKKGFWHNYDIETYFTLDRQELESEGEAWSSAQKEMYYTHPIDQRDLPVIPACFQVLGLTMPCSQEDLKEAYRQKAKLTHPDGGGCAEAFLALQQCYEEALEFLENL
jgi:hypothetical protein